MLPIDNRNIRNSLCERGINGASGSQSSVKLTRCFLGRAFLRADTTSGTLAHIHASCFLADIYLKVSNETGYLFYLTVCKQVNPLMSRSLYHLRGQDTCGAVQGREGLVQLGHSSTNTRCFLHDIYFVTCICNIQCSLDSRDSTADNQCTFYYFALTWLKRCI